MSWSQVEQLQADAFYCRDRVALLRARLYRRGVGTNARLQELERELKRVEQRLQDARLRASH
jgi:hypothetical protein